MMEIRAGMIHELGSMVHCGVNFSRIWAIFLFLIVNGFIIEGSA